MFPAKLLLSYHVHPSLSQKVSSYPLHSSCPYFVFLLHRFVSLIIHMWTQLFPAAFFTEQYFWGLSMFCYFGNSYWPQYYQDFLSCFLLKVLLLSLSYLSEATGNQDDYIQTFAIGTMFISKDHFRINEGDLGFYKERKKRRL